MKKIKEVLTSNFAKRLYWNIANGVVGLGLVYFSGESLWYAPLVIAVLNGLTKEINTKLSE
jgi:hypothetical protein